MVKPYHFKPNATRTKIISSFAKLKLLELVKLPSNIFYLLRLIIYLLDIGKLGKLKNLKKDIQSFTVTIYWSFSVISKANVK